MDRFDLILSELGALLGIETVLRFEDDCCAFHVEGISVNMQRDSLNNRIIMSAFVLSWPQDVKAALLEQLLIGNLYWQSGGTICLEPNSRSLLMLRPEHIDGLSPQHLLAILKRFVVNVVRLREQVLFILAN